MTIYAYGSWWVDAGNGENYGQVLIGNTNVAADMVPDGEIYRGLPLPTIQRPELLNQAPKARDCAAIAEEQGPTINLVMAAVVVEVVQPADSRHLLLGAALHRYGSGDAYPHTSVPGNS